MKKIFYIVASLFVLTSCEDVIEVEVEEGTVQMAVDAFLNNKAETQKITLKETKQFFDNVEQSAKLVDSVWVSDDLNNVYQFEDLNNDGVYEWDDSVLVHNGRTYTLNIANNGLLYTASSTANSVPQIDSLNWEYIPAGLGGENGGYAVELVARDLAGQTDYYWIRAYKNGVVDSRKSAINISVDGSFSAESNADGQLFIPPISTFPAINLEDSVGLGDIFKYEIWSLTEESYGFWSEVINQNIDGGIGALFATPTANVKSNIQSPSDNLSEKAVGWFSTSMVSSASQLIYEKDGEKLNFNINN